MSKPLIGAALGALPGLTVLLAGLVFVSGEAELSVILIGAALAVLGALMGGAIAAAPRLDVHGGVLGAGIGALPGLVLSRVLPGTVITLGVLAAGALIGWIAGNRGERHRPRAMR